MDSVANEPEARNFMNYPYNVSGGQTAFFSDFAYRFSDNELVFMLHAPERFVQMGNADWFDHHGFEQASASPEPALVRFERGDGGLEVRIGPLEDTADRDEAERYGPFRTERDARRALEGKAREAGL